MQRRKVTFQVYADKSDDKTLCSHLALHQQLYNAALEERIDAWRKFRISISYNHQQNMLPALKREMPELVPLGSQALQETLRRLDRAFASFYRRCAAGQAPGFPRFKSLKRFQSFCYPSPAGWSLIPLESKAKNARVAILRVGDLKLRVRGMCRFESFEPNDLTLKRIRPGVWQASVTLRVHESDCKRERTGNLIRGFDQGLTDRLVFDDGQTVENTRLLRNKLDALAALQQDRAKCKKRSRRYKALTVQIAKLHSKVANQRKDELHKLSSAMVAQCELLATEEMALANLTRAPKPKPELDAQGNPTGHYLPNGAAAKAGLNREMLSSGMGFLLQMLQYKAEEAGTRLHVANTKKLKPTQRCACCGQVVKKRLDERMHLCEKCGFCTSRDRNSALVCLIDALWPTFYESVQKKRFFCPDGSHAFIRNRLLYVGADTHNYLAHGTGVINGAIRETPTLSSAQAA